MTKFSYDIVVIFDVGEDDDLYKGDSWYDSRICDHLDITRKIIRLNFERSKKHSFEELMHSPRSNVRFQFYRAVCFYLAVSGKLPSVKSLKFRRNEVTENIEISKYTRNWNDCNLKYVLNSDSAGKIFRQEGKQAYIALSYYIKAQIDLFPHDCFRSAWSAFNVFYDAILKKGRDKEKLKKLQSLIEKLPMLNASQYLKSIDETNFWDRLLWYQYIEWKSQEKVKKEIFQTNYYRDNMIYLHLAEYTIGILRKNADVKLEEVECCLKIYEKQINKKITDFNEQIRFLVCDYCYMIRNRSVHAGVPYPVFGLFEKDNTSIEGHLTNIILLTIKDIFSIL